MRSIPLSVVLFASSFCPALAETLHIDARQSAAPPQGGYLKMGTSAGSRGTLTINSRYLTRDGHPWVPVMGEFHFTRYPAAYWEEELLKMKAAGIDTVAAYIIWNQHELAPGKLDWTGDRDLRRFAELCAKHKLNMFLRPGPWVHAETRFGGLPDWIVETTVRRSNDPRYMAEVERFWSGIARELKGLMWKDGGPVLGVQIENEYNLAGPGQGADHIASLKALALKLGLDVPLYTVTGWDNAVYPRGEVAPVDGAYVDEPWGAGTGILSPRSAYTFRFEAEMATGLGAQTAGDTARIPDAIRDRPFTPYLGAEFGSGLPVMYRRRPIVAPDDVGSTIVTQMGSGLNLLGYYMFHGGRNPTAGGRGLEETAREGAFNDVPKISYDFQGALGQYGETNPVQAYLRPLHYFLDSFGDVFAPTVLRRPDVIPSGPDDLATPRVAVRANGGRGFVFMNNYVRNYPMQEHKAVRFTVDLPTESLTFPSRAIDIAGGSYFFFPFHLDMDGVDLSWATAQPIARVDGPDGPLFVFSAIDGIPVEFAFGRNAIGKVPGKGRLADGHVLLDIAPSERIVEIGKRDGRTVKILVLSRADSRRLWILDAFGRKQMILTDATVFADQGLVLRQKGSPAFALTAWPALPDVPGLTRVSKTGGLAAYRASVARQPAVALRIDKVREEKAARPIDLIGPGGSAVQPAPEAYDAAATWRITIPPKALQGVEDAWLTLEYKGDVARLSQGNSLLDDMFWDGRKWRIGLRRFADLLGKPWDLNILPLRADAPIYFEKSAQPDFAGKKQLVSLVSATIEPEYEWRIEPRAR